MSGITTRSWCDEDETVWFAVDGIGPEYGDAVQHVLMDYERVGSEWRRGYPGDTPHLERAWENFAGCIERMLRQAARLEPVPWREALREVCQRTNDGGAFAGDRPVAWWLTGSAALAVRGAPLEPGDLDLVCDSGDAMALGELFNDAMIEPVAPASADWLSEWWGRAFCGARVEWVGGVKPYVDEPEPCDFGPEAGRRLEVVEFEDWEILVPPLDLQRAVNERRGLSHRVAMIDALTA